MSTHIIPPSWWRPKPGNSLAIKFSRLFTAICLMSVALSAEEIFTLDVVKPVPAHPRHDHQLIFPLKDGRLMMFWSEYYAVAKSVSPNGKSRDDTPCRISAKLSDDGGRSWGETFLFQENTGKLNVKHPNLLRLPSGELLFFYTEWNSLSNRDVLFKRSPDEGKTWSEPRRLSPGQGITNINNDHVLRLRSGRIILPAFSSPSVWDKNDHFQAFCYYSDDEGKTWQTSERRMDLPLRGAEEPCMIELKDSSLMVVLRTSLGSIYSARSSDGGNTWSEPTSTGLPAPASPPLLKRIPSTGDLLIIWNHNYEPDKHHQGERNPLSSAISKDEGKTWENIKNIENVPGGSAAYAAATFLGENALVTYYYQVVGFGGASAVRLKIIPQKWFYE
jgi:sialidase-1